jgi:hypothetical protein
VCPTLQAYLAVHHNTLRASTASETWFRRGAPFLQDRLRLGSRWRNQGGELAFALRVTILSNVYGVEWCSRAPARKSISRGRVLSRLIQVLPEIVFCFSSFSWPRLPALLSRGLVSGSTLHSRLIPLFVLAAIEQPTSGSLRSCSRQPAPIYRSAATSESTNHERAVPLACFNDDTPGYQHRFGEQVRCVSLPYKFPPAFT